MWTEESIARAVETQRAFFRSGATLDVSWRIEQLRRLRGCEAHSSVILSSVDERILRRLGINLTCEPKHESQNLYHR